MEEKWDLEKIQSILEPKKKGDRDWFLSFLDDEKQRLYEEERLDATLRMLRLAKIAPRQKRLRDLLERIEKIEKSAEKTAKAIKRPMPYRCLQSRK